MRSERKRRRARPRIRNSAATAASPSADRGRRARPRRHGSLGASEGERRRQLRCHGSGAACNVYDCPPRVTRGNISRFLALLGYDFSGLRYAGARLPWPAVLLASFCGFAIGNTVGLGAFSGGAVRYRLYSAVGLSPGQIARVIFFIATAFGIGLATIAALGLVLRADEVSGFARRPARTIAVGCRRRLKTSATAFLIFCAVRRTSLRFGPINLTPPGGRVVADPDRTGGARHPRRRDRPVGILAASGTELIAFAAVYAAALTLGVLSHVPGGLGVFEVAILCAFGNKAPPSAVAAALVIYRAIYFLLPMLLATVLLAGFEARRALYSEIGQRFGRAAAQLAPSFIAVTTLASAQHLSSPARCRPSSIACRSCRSAYRSGRSRRPTCLAASPGSFCFSPREGCFIGLTARGGWPFRSFCSASPSR